MATPQGTEQLRGTEEVRQGTLDLLILKTLSIAPAHGWAIGQRIQQLSGEVFQVNQGSLYPALHRLEHSGLVAAEWRGDEADRRARLCSLNPHRPPPLRGR